MQLGACAKAAPHQASGYTPPRWLRNAHAQTIYAACLAPRPRIFWRRERWRSPDGDFIDLDWLAGAAAGAGTTPSGEASLCAAQGMQCAAASESVLIVLFHGLEGSSKSHYARTLMQGVAERGWCGVVVHFRGCSGEPNQLPRAYHSGDSEEIDWILRRMRSQYRGPIAAIGVSLGGNVLLKWLGERGALARATLAAACAVSAPVDLTAAGAALDGGINRVYAWNFLRTLKRKGMELVRRHPGLLELEPLRRAFTLHAFDDHVTAPLHGFFGADDYWRRASSKPWLKHIAVPTLLLNARDDPFLPARALPSAADVSAAVALELPEHGGHAAFVSGRFPGSLDWMPQRTLSFIAHALRARDAQAA
jgi:predicted alpha/beta-fold hydrolase